MVGIGAVGGGVVRWWCAVCDVVVVVVGAHDAVVVGGGGGGSAPGAVHVWMRVAARARRGCVSVVRVCDGAVRVRVWVRANVQARRPPMVCVCVMSVGVAAVARCVWFSLDRCC